MMTFWQLAIFCLLRISSNKVDYVVFFIDPIIHISVAFHLSRKGRLLCNESDWVPGCPLFAVKGKVWSLCRLTFSYWPFFQIMWLFIKNRGVVLWHVIILNKYDNCFLKISYLYCLFLFFLRTGWFNKEEKVPYGDVK